VLVRGDPCARPPPAPARRPEPGAALPLPQVSGQADRERPASLARKGNIVMSKGRLEAFSDGVLAILITILVLELKIPHGVTLQALLPLLSVFLAYILSFVFLGIYWNNHHHLLHAVKQVRASILWANLHLLFWLSLIPFVTGWMGENHFARIPSALYGLVLFMSGLGYWILQTVILADHDSNSTFRVAIGKDIKGKISVGLYLTAIFGCLFISPRIAWGIFVLVALLWLIPDKRIETALIKSLSE
jgi:uncharacterized membrane protein